MLVSILSSHPQDNPAIKPELSTVMEYKQTPQKPNTEPMTNHALAVLGLMLVRINGETGEPGDFPRKRLPKARCAPSHRVLMKRPTGGAVERGQQFFGGI